MKEFVLLALVFVVSQFSFADTTCNNTKLPLDELQYMDVDDLNLKYCSAEKFQSLYLKGMMIDAVSACNSAVSTIMRVLDKEHNSAPPDCKTLFPSLYGEEQKEIETETEPKQKLRKTTALPFFSPNTGEEKNSINLYCKNVHWEEEWQSAFIKLFASGNPKKMEIGITPLAINYVEGNSTNEFAVNKEGGYALIAPKRIELIATNDVYYMYYYHRNEYNRLGFAIPGVVNEIPPRTFREIEPNEIFEVEFPQDYMDGELEKKRNYYSMKSNPPKFSGWGEVSGSILLDRESLRFRWSKTEKHYNEARSGYCKILPEDKFKKTVIKATKKGFNSARDKYLSDGDKDEKVPEKPSKNKI